MALLTKVGTFDASGSTGNQAITGVGFQPKALILWGSGSSVLDTWSSNVIQGFGISTGPLESYAQAATRASISTEGKIAAAAFIQSQTNSTYIRRANLESFDSDGFTLDWVEATTSNYSVVHYLAIGGDGLTDAKVVPWSMKGSTGIQSVTGFGFQPDAVIHAHAGHSGTSIPFSDSDGVLGVGVMNADGDQWAMTSSHVDGRYHRTDSSILRLNTSGSDGGRASFVSMDSDGFTIDWTTTSISTYPAFSLALKGVGLAVGTFTKTTSSSPVSQAITGLDIEPQAMMFFGVGMTALDTTNNVAMMFQGGSDGATSAAGGWLFDENDTYSTTSRTYIHNITDTSSVEAGANLDSFDANGFTLDWMTNDAAATYISYIALASGAPTVVDATANLTVAEATALSVAPTASGGASAAIGSTATSSGTGVAVSASGGATGSLTAAASSTATAPSNTATGGAIATLAEAVLTALSPTPTVSAGSAATLLPATASAQSSPIVVAQPDAIVNVPSAESSAVAVGPSVTAGASAPIGQHANATAISSAPSATGGAVTAIPHATASAQAQTIIAFQPEAFANLEPAQAFASSDPIVAASAGTAILGTANATATAPTIIGRGGSRATMVPATATSNAPSPTGIGGSLALMAAAQASTVSPAPSAFGGVSLILGSAESSAIPGVMGVEAGALVHLDPVTATAVAEMVSIVKPTSPPRAYAFITGV